MFCSVLIICGIICCRLLADAPVKLTTFEEAKLFLDGKIPKGFDSVTDVSVLGLFKENSDAGITTNNCVMYTCMFI